MKYRKKVVTKALALLILLCPLLAQREASYRVVIDDQQVPGEVRAAFKSIYPQTMFSIWYTSHITYWYEDYAGNIIQVKYE